MRLLSRAMLGEDELSTTLGIPCFLDKNWPGLGCRHEEASTPVSDKVYNTYEQRSFYNKAKIVALNLQSSMHVAFIHSFMHTKLFIDSISLLQSYSCNMQQEKVQKLD